MEETPVVAKKRKIIPSILSAYRNPDEKVLEIGVDEAGRGPLFGRVYAAAVILPRDFDCSQVKDSKKYHSKKKIDEASDYIKAHAIAWHVSFEDEKVIDEINILQATQKAMHDAILQVWKQVSTSTENQDKEVHLLVDGNYFKELPFFDKKTLKMGVFPYTCVEGGDGKYASIAAASILAKTARDQYIDDLCAEHPFLSEFYGLDKNKGYGAKVHLEGIQTHGITGWHRKTFGICKQYSI